MEKNRKELQADVVVIGTGASGLCAALTASFGGATVIVFEKMRKPGGMSNFAEGLFAVESKLQKQNKIGLTVEEAFKRHMEGTHWQANGRLVRNFMEKTAGTIEWLENLGVVFTGVRSIYTDGPLVWHIVKGLAATGLIKPLFERAEAGKNIKFFMETPVKSIVRKNGKIAGVTVEDKEGNTIQVKSKAVIIATGGYQSNPEWLEKYCEAGRYMTPFVPSKQTGDAIQMAWDIGAAPEGMGVVQAFPYVPGERYQATQLIQAGMHPYLWVNQRGERFCDESTVWRFPIIINALAKQPKGVAYCIFDENTKTYLKEQGIQFALGEYWKPTQKLDELDQKMEEGLKEGKVFQGDSLRELAEKLGANPRVFKATVDEYNKCFDKNYDFVFAKHRMYLQPVRVPKFYAIKLAIKVLITEGGIKINHNTEVLDKEDEVIPGLYAVGCSAGGFVGKTYVVATTGGSLGFAVNSGRMAGESVLEYLKGRGKS